jgi:hypothetical protein
MNVVTEMTGDDLIVSRQETASPAAPSAQSSGTTLTPEGIAALTEAIRAELRHEAKLAEKSRFWGDVSVSAIFMLLGAMFGELRGLLGLARR